MFDIRRRPLGVCRLSFVVFLAACASQPLVVTDEPETLRVVAPDSFVPLMEELAVAYREERPWVTVQVGMSNDAVARERLWAGAADLAVLSWLGDDQGRLWSVPFATDAVAVVVHPDVPSDGLDVPRLRELFRGRYDVWEDGTPVQVVSREDGAGLRSVFEAMVMDGHDVTLTALVAADDEGVLEAVAATPGGIGYVPLARLGDGVRAVSIAGVWPMLASLGDYPLTYFVYFGASSEPSGEARIFVQWVLEAQGQALVARHLGFAP